MLINIRNEEFGWDTATYGYWVAFGNPTMLRWQIESASIQRTGSIHIYKYNINTDEHDPKAIIYRPLSTDEDVLLSAESSSADYYDGEILHTEDTGTVPITADLDISLDIGNYYTASEDDYGRAIDINRDAMVVGNTYWRSDAVIFTASYQRAGSGSVDVYDLSKLNIDSFADRQEPIIYSQYLSDGWLYVKVWVPPNQNYGVVYLNYRPTISDPFQRIAYGLTTNAGGYINIKTNFVSVVSTSLLQVEGEIDYNPYVISILNPNQTVTESFGYAVSLNDEWLAVGSVYESSSRGAVFMYRKDGGYDGDITSWSLYQTISPPAACGPGDSFGAALSLNKFTGSYSCSLLVGSLKPSQSRAYYYEFTSASGWWSLKHTFYPTYETSSLNFYNTLPIITSDLTTDGFGHSVSLYKDTAVIGAPYDREFQEYSGSSIFKQGSVYFFERCTIPKDDFWFYFVKKSYGNENTLKNNILGHDVSTWGNYTAVGAPKNNGETGLYICYIRGSIFQQHYCSDDLENLISGQYVLYDRHTSSLNGLTDDWNIVNVFQKKKRLMNPYRSFGFSVSLSEDFLSVGSPMRISGSYRIMDLSDSGSYTGSLESLSSISGKGYIYNLNNLRETFYVGNVFYRNGKVIVMTSGSSFSGLMLSNIPGEEYQYQINFKSKHTIYEKQVVCPVEPGEFNVSTNPTAITYPISNFDINRNGIFDFQDMDVLLRYMRYKSTETPGPALTDWTSSLLLDSVGIISDELVSVYNMYSSSWNEDATKALFTSSYSVVNNLLYTTLDFNEDSKIDTNDQQILWKYFIHRLTQKNYNTYITPNSQKKFLSDILDYLNEQTKLNSPPLIGSDFLDYEALSKADPTGSYLAPYVTTIGFYSGADLVAVAKLGSPIKIVPDFPMNFVVKMDF